MKAETSRCAYPANLMAIIALIFFCFLFFHQGKKRKSGCGAKPPRKPQRTSYAYQTNKMKAETSLCTYPDNLMAIIALILFCFLFFHQGKKRKSGRGGEAPAKAPTNLLRLPDEPDEGPNNPLRPFGQLDGDHRLDLLLLPFLPSREEKEVGVRGRSPRERSNEPPAPTKRTP